MKKDVSEPSYDDLKFRIWNSNYFYTNQIVTILNSKIQNSENMIEIYTWTLIGIAWSKEIFNIYG